MLYKLRKRAQGAEGFTLIELLVVILIIGILAAIAIPSFLGQRSKAQDATAKTSAKTAQTAMETYYTDAQSYTGATAAELKKIEPTLGANTAEVTVADPTITGNDYTVTVTSVKTGTTFSIARAGSATTRSCTVTDANKPGGCKLSSGTTGSW